MGEKRRLFHEKTCGVGRNDPDIINSGRPMLGIIEHQSAAGSISVRHYAGRTSRTSRVVDGPIVSLTMREHSAGGRKAGNLFGVRMKRKTKTDAAMGIRTPVEGVRVLHDWPVYTIAADLLITWHARRFKHICPSLESPAGMGFSPDETEGCARSSARYPTHTYIAPAFLLIERTNSWDRQ